GRADRTEDRREVGDGAATGTLDGRDLIFHAVEYAAQVDVDHLAPRVDAVIGNRIELAADPGVVHRQMECPEAFLRKSHRLFRRLRGSDIVLHGGGLATRLPAARP